MWCSPQRLGANPPAAAALDFYCRTVAGRLPPRVRFAWPPSSDGPRQASIALNLRQKELDLLKITDHRGATWGPGWGYKGQGSALDPLGP
jgi:hypothetical protein